MKIARGLVDGCMSKALLCVVFVFGFVAFVSGCLDARAVAQSADLDKVLAQMDAASAKFQSAQADFVWDQYVKIVDERDSQTGMIYFDRKGRETWMAAHITKPAAKEVVYKLGELQFLQPEIDQVTIFAAGVNRLQYESFLTLGFGGSGHDLANNWEINYEGIEAIAGVQTAKLDLVPKQADVKKLFEHVTIWVDTTRAISMKQQFFEPSGDVRTDLFTNIKYNQRVSATAFEIKTTSKTHVIRK